MTKAIEKARKDGDTRGHCSVPDLKCSRYLGDPVFTKLEAELKKG